MKITEYLPFENYVLRTSLSSKEVYYRLSNNIEPKKAFRLAAFNRTSVKPYEGIITNSFFKISSIVNYRNSFLPVIEGKISTFAGQTHIHIRMKVTPFVLIFISIWLGLVGLTCLLLVLVGIIHFIQNRITAFSPTVLIPFGMLIFGCLRTILAFKAESNKSREFLETLLDAQEIS